MTGPGRIVLIGSTGDLGLRITKALQARGADALAQVRPGADVAALEGIGAWIEDVDFADAAVLKETLRETACVVAALNDLEGTIIDLHGRVLGAAVAVGVPRFIPPDYSPDFTRTRPGRNRNLNLRRRFMARVDAAPIRATSILSGAFADLFAGQAPIAVRGARLVVTRSCEPKGSAEAVCP